MSKEVKATSAGDVLTGIERTLRSHRLYEGTGPQYWEHLESLTRLVRTYSGDTVFNLSPFGPYIDGDEPPTAQSPVRLWFELFEEGVRQVVIRRNVRSRELDEFLRVLGSNNTGSGDIVTRLWRKELANISTQVVRTLVGVCRTPEEALNDRRERLEYWRSQVRGISAGDSTGSDKGTALDEDDVRVLATSEHTYDWMRMARAPAGDEREKNQRPKMATEIDRQLQDFGRFLDIARVTGGEDDAFISAVLESMAQHGKVQATRAFCDAILGQSDDLSATLIERAQEILAEHVGPTHNTDSVDVFEAAPSPELKDSAAPELEIEEDLSEEIVAPEPEQVSDLDRFTMDLSSDNPRQACEAINGLFSIGTLEAIEIALTGYRSSSDSVRQLVLLHSIRVVGQRKEPELLELVDPLLLRAFDREEQPVRAKLLRCFRAHSTRAREEHLLKLVRQAGFKYRPMEEREAMVSVLAQHPLPSVINTLGAMLNQVRLFSTDAELQFQIKVGRHLLQIDTQESRAYVEKVIKGWTVPGRVKEELGALLKAGSGGGKS